MRPAVDGLALRLSRVAHRRSCAAGGGCRGRACPGCPGTASSSSRLAPTQRSGEPKCVSSARLRTGPTPGSSSSTERVIAWSRRCAVELDREPVRLVAHPLEQLQRLRVGRRSAAAPSGPARRPPRSASRGRPPRRPRSAERRERPHARRELALAAVDHDQVGQRGEALVALGVVRRAVRLLEEAAPRAGRAPPPSTRSRRARPRGRRGSGTAGSPTSSARRPRTRPSRPRCGRRRGWRCRSPRSGPAATSSSSASCSAASASTRCWRRRSWRSLSWASARRALRSASSRRRRLSPRSATRTSTGPPRRVESASSSSSTRSESAWPTTTSLGTAGTAE